MQHYIGTDIIEIERIRQAIALYGERFLNRVFTKDELQFYGHHAHALAASFASKEAVMKVLGTGNRGVAWREIETLYHPTGKPYIRLNGRAQKVAAKLGIKEIDVSLSHSRDNAIATAIGSTQTS
ncbi:MAG: holo-ACP synthase [Dehalococcoidales bacterium]|jgi:holo-[acyl-carrier protein] synthase